MNTNPGSPMSFHQRILESTLQTLFARKLSGPLDRGWGDTVVGPQDPLHESDFEPTRPPYGKFFSPTMPMDVIEVEPNGHGLTINLSGQDGGTRTV